MFAKKSRNYQNCVSVLICSILKSASADRQGGEIVLPNDLTLNHVFIIECSLIGRT